MRKEKLPQDYEKELKEMIERPMYYKRDGTPYTGTREQQTLAWAKDFEKGFPKTNDNHIAQDTINGYRISTIWLGLDHNWGSGKPLIFETMVFHEEKGEDKLGIDQSQWRYSTEKAALINHKKIVKAIQNIDLSFFK